MRYSLDKTAINEGAHDSAEISSPVSPHRSSPAPQTNMTRPRSPTPGDNSMTPQAKRSKIEITAASSSSSSTSILVHPGQVPVPSKRTISALYRAALSTNNGGGDQAYLKPAGLLSLEQVLLPALGLEEEKILKRLQSKIQRDAPEYKSQMERNRRTVRKAILRAMEAVQRSRVARCQHQQDLRQQKVEQRKAEREAKRQARARALEEKRAREAEEKARQEEEKAQQEEEKARQREVERQERKRMLQKHYPRNQELRKEVVFLTSSISQLEKEERMWIQAEQQLIQKLPATPGNTTNKDDAEKENEVVVAPKHSLQEEAERTLQDIALTSTRIQTGLGMVLQIAQDAENVRKEVYRKYKEDHRFDGYQQVHNPKSMIRFLSQDD